MARFLQRDAQGHLSLNKVPIQHIVLNWSFEQLCYYLLESDSDDFAQYEVFHDHAVYQRSLLAQSLNQRRPLFAPVMPTLQSLASSLTVYQHDWAYFNQLLMSFGVFFQEDVAFYEQFEQQIFVAGARQTLNPLDLPLVSALMNLWTLQEESSLYPMLKIYAQAQVDMPAAVSAAMGLMSSRGEIADWGAFSPWIESFAPSRRNLEQDLQKRPILGFISGPLQDTEKYLLGKQIAAQLAQNSEVFYPIYQTLLSIENLLQTKGYSPKWEIYPVAALHSLGLYPNWMAPWIAFCRLPTILSQYRIYEQQVAMDLMREAL